MTHKKTQLLALALIAGCTGDLTNQRAAESPSSPAAPAAPPAPTRGADTSYVIAAGDVAGCPASYQDEATAAIIMRYPNAEVLALGDLAYPDGSAGNYTCYEASWGAFKERTRPVPGNHEYHTAGAAGYFGYFGAAAGDPAKGYYTYDVGSWRIYALNSEVSTSATGAQVAWLKADLAARPAGCVLAYWHRPLFSSSTVHTGQLSMRNFWAPLEAAGADIVLSSHNHHYERFAPQTVDGIASRAGIRLFVAGGGGSGSLYNFLPEPAANSEVRYKGYGVLLLGLYPGGYTWKHLALPEATFTDAGSAACTGAAEPPPPASSSIPLTVSGRFDATRHYMTLKWTGATGASVDVYRNGPRITVTANDGHYVNSRGFQGAATYVYKVCGAGTSDCSRDVSVSVGGGAPPPPPPPPAPSAVKLSVSGRNDATRQYMTLRWTGAAGAALDVYRNGARITNTANDGYYVNSRAFQGAVTYRYKVCKTGTSVCSNEASVTFSGPSD